MPTAKEVIAAGFRAGHAARQKMVAISGTTAYIVGEEMQMAEAAGDEDSLAKSLPVSLQFQWVMAYCNGYRQAALGMSIPVEYQQTN